MAKRPYEWRVDTQSCNKFNNADLARGPRDTTAPHLPVLVHCAPPISGALTACLAALKLSNGS